MTPLFAFKKSEIHRYIFNKKEREAKRSVFLRKYVIKQNHPMMPMNLLKKNKKGQGT